MKISVQRVKEIIREELETLNEGNDQFMHILKIHGFKKHGKPWAGHYFFKGPDGYYATLNPKARYLDISKGNRSVHNGYAWTSLVRFFAKQGLRKTNEGKLKENGTIKFSKTEMDKLHNDGKLEKDGHIYMFNEGKWSRTKLTEARKETIFDVAKRVVKNRSAEKYKSGRGTVLLDMQSANLLTKVFKKVNPKMKKILSKLGYDNPAQLMATLWTVAKAG